MTQCVVDSIIMNKKEKEGVRWERMERIQLLSAMNEETGLSLSLSLLQNCTHSFFSSLHIVKKSIVDQRQDG